MRAIIVVLVACLTAVTFRAARGGQPPNADEQLLRAAGLVTDNEGLLQYLRRLSAKTETSQVAEQPAAAARLLAARRMPGTIDVLLNYLPVIHDDWLEEEVLTSLGVLAVQAPGIDPLLTAALKDKVPGRRAAAVYVLGRRGGLDQRETVRSFLADADALVRRRAAQALIGKRPARDYQDRANADEALLKSQGLATDEPALLELLRRRTPDEADQQRLRGLVADLGAPSFPTRHRASKMLVKEGTAALAFLRPALHDPDAEVMRRANLCIEEIRRGAVSALPAAAVRLLARPPHDGEHAPAAAIRVLLAYAPFADDDAIEDEVANALTLLSTREVKIDPLLPEALRDPLAARRAMAAHVLGRVGTAEQRADLRKLLDDPVANVRVRAAQGLVLAKDRTAVPRLIALLNEAPFASLWQVEELLQRLAGAQAPLDSVAEGSPEKRLQAARAWERWYARYGPTLDLGHLAEGNIHQGLLTICEYDSAVGQSGGQVWEAGRDGKPRWKITGLLGAMDAQVLPSGRILVAENSVNRVTERDLTGAIKWEYRTPGNPIACQRLPNGNTFIATYNQVMEITPDRRQLYVQTKGPQFYIFSARKRRDGVVVAMTAQGTILRFDPLANKDYPSINLGPNGGWCSVEALPNGRYLVATMNNGQVREVDAAGTTHWSVSMQGCFRATRLPNGNTLVASMTSRLVAEFDPSGTKRWEKTCEGRPWSIRYR